MKKQNILINSLVVILLVQCVASLRVGLSEKEPSFTINFQTNGRHTFYMVSSGKEEHNITVTINHRGQAIFNQTGNDIQFTYDFGSSNISITLTSPNQQDRKVSFDFYAENDPLIHIIDKRDVKYVAEGLSDVHKVMQTVSRNQQFHIERDQSHKATLEESESHIKWTGIIKIIFLLSSALIQLWIMKGFFKSGDSHAYQPVATS